MSRGLGALQRRILDALDPAQEVCGRPGAGPHETCFPENCYGWTTLDKPLLWIQLPLDVYDLDKLRRYLNRQEAPRWQRPPLPPLPSSLSSLEVRAWTAILSVEQQYNSHSAPFSRGL